VRGRQFERRNGIETACEERAVSSDQNERRVEMKTSVPDKVLVGLDDAFTSAGRVYKVRTRSKEDVLRLRNSLELTQKEFAEKFGISIQTIQKWEQGTRTPEGPANSFLALIERMPSEVMSALQADRAERVTLEN
jgi:putative transcriptional regulator